MAEDLMQYAELAQQALRGVVRLALRKVEREGLPGEHHFFIAFSTTHPGVTISERLKNRYPEEMTIVLQHQYWNLAVRERDFQVELSFDNIPERLVVPFAAIKGFLDPHVQFGLQFEPGAEEDEGTSETAAAGSGSRLPEAMAEAPGDVAPAAPASNDDSKVVSIDAFRKK
jgi:hypothetical protein